MAASCCSFDRKTGAVGAESGRHASRQLAEQPRLKGLMKVWPSGAWRREGEWGGVWAGVDGLTRYLAVPLVELVTSAGMARSRRQLPRRCSWLSCGHSHVAGCAFGHADPHGASCPRRSVMTTQHARLAGVGNDTHSSCWLRQARDAPLRCGPVPSPLPKSLLACTPMLPPRLYIPFVPMVQPLRGCGVGDWHLAWFLMQLHSPPPPDPPACTSHLQVLVAVPVGELICGHIASNLHPGREVECRVSGGPGRNVTMQQHSGITSIALCPVPS